VQFDTLDHIEHFLWRYSDPGDPMYPGKNDHASRILDFYRYFDEIVGRFQQVKDSETAMAIVSGHGHERRCVYRLHINEWLRLRNLLTPEKQKETPSGRVNTKASWLARSGQQLHLFSRNKAVPGVDTANSQAYLVELASASPFGGIALNRDQLTRGEGEQDYEQVRTEILLGLEQLRINESPVVMWAKRREDCYEGKFLMSYPDILFELRSDFGVDRSLYTALVVPDATHRLVSGAHNAHGVLLLENYPTTLEAIEGTPVPNVMDVAPTVLRLLEVEYEEMDGCSLVHAPLVRQLI
jgi:predicted AlkP superfamily phosphohydrolase/phosphomutase